MVSKSSNLTDSTSANRADHYRRIVDESTERKQIEQQLLDSEQRDRVLFEASPHPMWVYDSESLSILTVNNAAVRGYGYSETEFLAMTVRDIQPQHLNPDFDENYTSAIAAVLRKHLKKDGSIIDAEITSQPIIFSDKQAALITATDVTARVRAEAEGRAILNVIQSVNVTRKLDDLLKFIHQSLKGILYAENCFVALHDPDTDLIHFEYWIDKVDSCPPPRPMGDGFTSHVLRTGQVMSLTPELKKKLYGSGTVTRIGTASASWLGVPLRTPSRTIGIIVVQHYEIENIYSQHDINFLTSVGGQIALAIERKQGEQALHEANQRAIKNYDELLQRITTLAESFGTSRDLHTICHALHQFAQVSTSCEGMLVSTNDSRTGASALVFKSGNKLSSRLSRSHSRCLATAKVIVENTPGSPIETALIVPMLINGVVVGAVEIHNTNNATFKQSSITATKMAAGLAASAIENVRLLQIEREQEEELRQSHKMEAIGKLAGGIAHDFNNLLTAITGYSDISLRRLPPNDPVRRNLEEIQRASARATSLTRQLLAFSRKQILQAKIFDLNTVVIEMDKLLRRLIGANIELKTVLGDNLGHIHADPGQIEQVLMNLVVNARDASLDYGEITIETANVDLVANDSGSESGTRQYVMLSVSDNGSGIDETTRKRIFDPFFTTKGVGKGTGLGLSTVYGVVEQSNGKIEVLSEVGKGSKFMIYLPRAEKQQISNRKVKNDLVPNGNETILIAEDEPLVRSMTRNILELSGYNVLEAENGLAAVKLCKSYDGPLHLLLTDVVMPLMSGPRLCEEITRIRPEVKTLFMSGYTDSSVVHEGVLQERMHFLQKPFTPDALAKKVRRVLDSVADSISSQRALLPR